jgi:hypothetical protein
MAGKVAGLIAALKKSNPAAMAQMKDHGGRIEGKPIVSDNNPKGTQKSLAEVGWENSSGPTKKRYERLMAREKSKQ